MLCPRGTSRFSGIANSNKPKLYIASFDEKPFYVGWTKQRMKSRLDYGWKATGRGGYYGYKWRHQGETAYLDIWWDDDDPQRKGLNIETIEAEVVFLIRQAGQWPAFQTEIHFHPSSAEHRHAAAEILSRYRL